MARAKSYVLAFDAHYPEHDPWAWACVMSYTRRNRPDGFIFGGDQLDLACVSHHNDGKPLYKPQGALKSNLDGFAREILDPLDMILGPDCDKRFIMGNHEAWLTNQLAETQPELDGMIDLPEYLDLDARGYEVIPQGGFTQLGHLYVLHGDTIGGGMHHAKKAVDTWARSVAFGHHHTLQAFTRSSPAHESERWTATSIPCLSHTAPTYGRGRANTWMNGFAICYVRSDGTFNLQPVVIVDGICTVDGKTYGKRRAA